MWNSDWVAFPPSPSSAKFPESPGNASQRSSGGGAQSPMSNSHPNSPRDPPDNTNNKTKSTKDLPPLFWYMETGDWEKATERIRKHPREVKTWATLRTKTTDVATTKRLALHHACFKLRGAAGMPTNGTEDPFVEVCRFILLLIRLYPEAAQKRESRHGCLPLHLAAFASCAPRENDSEPAAAAAAITSNPLRKPNIAIRQPSDGTDLSAVHAEETYTGSMMTEKQSHPPIKQKSPVAAAAPTNTASALSSIMRNHNSLATSVSATNTAMFAKREAMLVQVINALLDAYPKAARVDSEGGRLPLHTACAGRATPRVIETLITAYPAAARQRNKDGFLPLHLAAHWGVSHISVAVQLLKVYPDATVGRNRWERTPLEEALCMAGENGRPHQAALVRALRKHPSWWTRPNADVFGMPTMGKFAVDIDESLPSNDSTMEEQIRLHQLRLQKQYRQYEEDGEDVDGEEDEIVSYDVDAGEEVGLPPSPPAGLIKRFSPRTFISKGKTKEEIEPDPLAIGVSLAHLIEKRKWNSVIARIKADPLEAEQELQVMTRGGFMASTGMSPLHYACERRPPAELVQRLVQAFPFAAMTRAMPGGCLPLHIACTWGASPEVVKALLAADSGSVRVKDELGNVALHSACFSGADSRIIEYLLEADIKSVIARNHQGSRPIDICKRLRHENRHTVMAILTRKKDELIKSHSRSRSSGVMTEIAREAEEMNHRAGTPSSYSAYDDPHDSQVEGGVEVTYDGEKKEEMLWI